MNRVTFAALAESMFDKNQWGNAQHEIWPSRFHPFDEVLIEEHPIQLLITRPLHPTHHFSAECVDIRHLDTRPEERTFGRAVTGHGFRDQRREHGVCFLGVPYFRPLP